MRRTGVLILSQYGVGSFAYYGEGFLLHTGACTRAGGRPGDVVTGPSSILKRWKVNVPSTPIAISLATYGSAQLPGMS